MPKIAVKTTLENIQEKDIFEYKGIGILVDNKIIYEEDHIMVKIQLEPDQIKIDRSNDEYILKMHFESKQESVGVYTLKQMALSFDLNIKTNWIKTTNHSIEINYDLFMLDELVKTYHFFLEYEVIV